jgi:hypothetical protein
VKPPDGAPDRQAEVQAGPAGRQDRDTTKACPSALCQEDALLLGVVAPGGTVAYIQPPTRVDAGFVSRAQALGHPERRFRFSSACLEGACPQWTGSACAVIDLVIGSRPDESAAGKAVPSGTALPACAIRRSCRWFAQRGAAACAVCPEIVADTGGTATYRSTQMTSGGSMAPPASLTGGRAEDDPADS